MQEDHQIIAELQANYKAADKTLNASYKRLYSEMDGAGRAKLVKAQRAWLAFRDSNAMLHADYIRGGAASSSGGDRVLYAVLVEMTHMRTRELDAIRAERNAAKKS